MKLIKKLSLIFLLLGFSTIPFAASAQDGQAQQTKIKQFDVAENGSRFVPDEAPVFEDGLPAYGNPFVTQGYIYPYGFLDNHQGVNADGSPAHPDKVIGIWTCRGTHLGDGARTVTGPWVFTTQLYDFSDQPGEATLISEGYELVDVNVPVKRAITGGTGPYKRASGEIEQTSLGFNASFGVNSRFKLK